MARREGVREGERRCEVRGEGRGEERGGLEWRGEEGREGGRRGKDEWRGDESGHLCPSNWYLYVCIGITWH